MFFLPPQNPFCINSLYHNFAFDPMNGKYTDSKKKVYLRKVGDIYENNCLNSDIFGTK